LGIELAHIAERKTECRYDEIKRESEGMGWNLIATSPLIGKVDSDPVSPRGGTDVTRA
jgi:hypothetical protein